MEMKDHNFISFIKSNFLLKYLTLCLTEITLSNKLQKNIYTK